MMAVECPGPGRRKLFGSRRWRGPPADEVAWRSDVDEYEHGTGAGGPLRDLGGAGRIRPVIDRTCLLDRACEVRAVSSRGTPGRIVVAVGDVTR